jgi:hypothetical protein
MMRKGGCEEVFKVGACQIVLRGMQRACSCQHTAVPAPSNDRSTGWTSAIAASALHTAMQLNSWLETT